MDGPKDPEGNILDPDFYTSIFSAVVKGCICRPSENLDADEWANAWGHKMSAFTGLPDTAVTDLPDTLTGTESTDITGTESTGDTLTGTESTAITDSLTDTIHSTVPIKENPEIDSIEVCAYCGFQENFLGSQFVMGQTWHDWEYDQDTIFYQTSSGVC
jgi:hypothetical protein